MTDDQIDAISADAGKGPDHYAFLRSYARAILQAATRDDAPSADAVDAQRWRYMTTHNATCSVEHMEQLIDGLMAENAARIATSAPKEST